MKKKLIITGAIVIVLIAVGFLSVRVGIDFVFDKYVLNATLSSIANVQDEVEETPENTETVVTPQQEEAPQESGNTEPTVPATTQPKLSKTEIISRVMKSSELTQKMSEMVSHEDKSRVIKIVLSNFTATEIAEIAKNVKRGLTSEYKSKMISTARSRLTSAQWQECLSVAYKYIEEIRPYVK